MGDISRASTGIDGLDTVLDGGIPREATVLVVGPPGVGKTTLVNQFMHTGVAADEDGLYIALDDAPDAIRDTATQFGWTLDDALFVDGYSWREGGTVSAEYAIESPSDLNQFNMTLSDAMRSLDDDRKRVVIDSVSTLVLYADTTSATKFLQAVAAKAKSAGSCLLMTLEAGMHDDKTVSTLNYAADGMVRMEMEDGQRRLSVQRMAKTSHDRDWHPFSITDDGIALD